MGAYEADSAETDPAKCSRNRLYVMPPLALPDLVNFNAGTTACAASAQAFRYARFLNVSQDAQLYIRSRLSCLLWKLEKGFTSRHVEHLRSCNSCCNCQFVRFLGNSPRASLSIKSWSCDERDMTVVCSTGMLMLGSTEDCIALPCCVVATSASVRLGVGCADVLMPGAGL